MDLTVPSDLAVWVAAGVYVLNRGFAAGAKLRQRRNGGSFEERAIKMLGEFVAEERRVHAFLEKSMGVLSNEHTDHRARLESIGVDIRVIKDRSERMKSKLP